MKVVVTGAAGFIGSHLVEGLLHRDGIDVVGIDSLTDYYDPKIKEARVERLASPRFTFHAEDLLEVDLARVFGDASVILHLAGQGPVCARRGAPTSETTQTATPLRRSGFLSSCIRYARSIASSIPPRRRATGTPTGTR